MNIKGTKLTQLFLDRQRVSSEIERETTRLRKLWSSAYMYLAENEIGATSSSIRWLMTNEDTACHCDSRSLYRCNCCPSRCNTHDLGKKKSQTITSFTVLRKRIFHHIASNSLFPLLLWFLCITLAVVGSFQSHLELKSPHTTSHRPTILAQWTRHTANKCKCCSVNVWCCPLAIQNLYLIS